MKSFKEFISEALVKTGHQLGSNPGGVHTDSDTGKKFYVKKYHNPEQAKAEVLTGKIYDHMGIHTLKPEMHGHDGVSTEWNDYAKQMHPSEFKNLKPEHANQIGKMYHAAVLTKNWDIVGLEHDNILHDKKTDNLIAADHGGAMHFRAMGNSKNYDHGIDEKQSLRNPQNPSGQVFNHTFKTHPFAEMHGLEAVKNIDDNHIHSLFKNSGLKDWKSHHDAFKARKSALIKSYE